MEYLTYLNYSVYHYDYILMKSIIEHLLYLDRVLLELYKFCKNGATIEIITDHYTNKGAYNSLEHQHHLNEIAFKTFVDSISYHKKRPFEIVGLKITPTKIGKLFPKFIRNKLSLFIGGLYSQIHIKYNVIK